MALRAIVHKSGAAMRPRLIAAAHAQRGSVAAAGFVQKRQHSAPPQSYTERMEKTGRPISPHVTIYSFPTTAISSITNRATGVALSAGVTGMGVVGFFGGDVAGIMHGLGHSDLGQVMKFGVAFSISYHYICGIRHVVWDKTVKGFDNESMEKSSTLVLGAAAVLSGGLALL